MIIILCCCYKYKTSWDSSVTGAFLVPLGKSHRKMAFINAIKIPKTGICKRKCELESAAKPSNHCITTELKMIQLM